MSTATEHDPICIELAFALLAGVDPAQLFEGFARGIVYEAVRAMVALQRAGVAGPPDEALPAPVEPWSAAS